MLYINYLCSHHMIWIAKECHASVVRNLIVVSGLDCRLQGMPIFNTDIFQFVMILRIFMGHVFKGSSSSAVSTASVSLGEILTHRYMLYCTVFLSGLKQL